MRQGKYFAWYTFAGLLLPMPNFLALMCLITFALTCLLEEKFLFFHSNNISDMIFAPPFQLAGTCPSIMRPRATETFSSAVATQRWPPP